VPDNWVGMTQIGNAADINKLFKPFTVPC